MNNRLPKRFIVRVIALAILMATTSAVIGQVVINEYCADNRKVEIYAGAYYDFIELYNPTAQSISLDGYYLSDDEYQLQKWTMPNVMVAPQGFLVVFASGLDVINGAFIHTNFKLDANEENVYFTSPDGELMDVLHHEETLPDQSIGRFPDGSQNVFALGNTTPAEANQQGEPMLPGTPTLITFSHAPGIYTSAFQLEINCNESTQVIRYTTDGSTPTNLSPIFTGSLQIEDRSAEPMQQALIATAPFWLPPLANIRKATVLNVAAFDGLIRTSQIHTSTYFIDPLFATRYGVPVVSITASPSDFFSDETGIYVPGFAEYGNYTHHGEGWERTTVFQYFNPAGELELSRNAGVRIHGRGTRISNQKSLRFYTDDQYGAPQLVYPFFGGNESQIFKRFVLRSPDPFHSQALFVNSLAQLLAGEMNVDAQAQQPVVLFLNGEYWGIHTLCERPDKHFLETHHGFPSGSFDILDWDEQLVLKEGKTDNYYELMDFVTGHDFIGVYDYHELQQLVDMDNFLDYLCAQLYTANLDFPSNNIRMYKSTLPGSKWRFVFYDADACFGDYADNLLDQWMAGSDQEDPVSVLVNALRMNSEFQSALFTKLQYHIAHTLETTRVLDHIDNLQKTYEPLLTEHIQRWAFPAQISEWLNDVNRLRNFAIYRPEKLLKQMANWSDNSVHVFPNPAASYIRINASGLDVSEITGVSVLNLQGTLQAVTYSTSNNVLQLDVDLLVPGVYHFRVNTYSSVYAGRFVVID